jgi:Flp pilus assembly protein TadG
VTRRGERGAAAVEMALVAPILITLLLGMIDMARLFIADQDVATASSEGAHYALSGGRYVDCAGIRTAAVRLSGRSRVSTGNVAIQYDTGPGTAVFASCPVAVSSLSTGNRIVITVTHTVDPIIPALRPVTIRATTRRTIIKR